METIGNRAAREITRRAFQNGIAPYKEAEKFGADSAKLSNWRSKFDPSAYYLKRMALAGYDVIYILTGERNGKV